MSPGVIALCAAGAAMLAVPLLAAGVGQWAVALRRSRSHTLDRGLMDIFVYFDPRRYAVLTAGLVAGVALLVTLLTGNGLIGFAGGAFMLWVPTLLCRRLRRSWRRRLLAQFPEALDLLASSLKSGLGLLPALQHLAQHQAAPLRDEFELLLRKQRLGVPLDQAFEEMRVRVGGAELGLFVTAVGIGRQLGGNLSDVLGRLAQTLRDKDAIERKIDALTAQGRLQARIVGLLPLLLLGVMSVMEPAAMRLLIVTAIGWAVLGVLCVLEISGFLLLRRILRIDV